MPFVDQQFDYDILGLYLQEDDVNEAVSWLVVSIDSLSLDDGIVRIGGKVTKLK